ncbi:MAG TPA: HrcA family transcriptional regulator, partial [Nocardioidaceae bacterium]|nr:HrcA family transcriptional regulator [Nocardioidaceae bacterium]
QRSVRMLAQLTRQVAVVQYPSLTRSTVRHVELVSLAPTRLLVVLITSTGRVEQRIVETTEEVGETLIGDLRARINLASLGERLVDAADRLAEIPETFEPGDRPIVTAVTSTLVEAFSDERSDERVAVGGTANLTHFGDDFDTSIRPVLEALEEHVVLLQLLGAASSPRILTVRIGHEVPYEELSSTSIVASGYGPSDDTLATLGVVGPTRMDYPGAMAAVRAVAHYVSRRLREE